MQFFNDEENSYDNNSIDNNPDEIERLKLKFNFSFLKMCFVDVRTGTTTDYVFTHTKTPVIIAIIFDKQIRTSEPCQHRDLLPHNI